MKVSIVTISFNQEEFLEDAIRSVLNQDYHDIEYIVVDPGSTDGSRNIIEKYHDKINHIVYEKDDGASHGLNIGFSYATGEVYGFLNADDILFNHAVSDFVKALQQRDVDVVSGHGFFINSSANRGDNSFYNI